MSLRLLIDEDTQARALVARLRQAGQDVLTVQEAGLMGQPDPEVLACAWREDRLLVTHNADDFRQLHQAEADPPGILVIYRDADPTKNMSHAAIVTALANLEASGWELSGQFVSLNAWNF